jgi:uncharacterized protein (UPF0332 family)
MIPFDWHKFLAVAENLRLLNNSESNRSGISRAYYAAFGKSRIFCKNLSIIQAKDFMDFSSNVHTLLIKELVSSEHDDLKAIGQRLKTLRARRNDADYNASCTESGKLSLLNNSINLSKEVMEYIANYKP